MGSTPKRNNLHHILDPEKLGVKALIVTFIFNLFILSLSGFEFYPFSHLKDKNYHCLSNR